MRNSESLPKLEKITLNMGVGEAVSDSKVIASAVADMTAITGRKPIVIRAKRSVATFKLREGAPVMVGDATATAGGDANPN